MLKLLEVLLDILGGLVGIELEAHPLLGWTAGWATRIVVSYQPPCHGSQQCRAKGLIRRESEMARQYDALKTDCWHFRHAWNE